MADSTKPNSLNILEDPIIREFQNEIIEASKKGNQSTQEELDKFMKGLKPKIRRSPITLPKTLSRMRSFSPLTTPSLTKSSSDSSASGSPVAPGQGMFDGGKSRTRKRKSKRRKRKKRKTKRKRKTRRKTRRKKSNKRKRKTRKRKRYKK